MYHEQSKTAHLAVRVYSSTVFDVHDDEESDEPVAYVAFHSDCSKMYVKPMPVTHMTARESVDWTLPEGEEPPEGHARKFPAGALKSRTFLDVILQHPEQYFSTRKSKSLSIDAREYLPG